MSRILISSILAGALLSLAGCGGSQHAADEKYYLIATSVKVPYWQQAGAGLVKAANQYQVQAELVGPDNFDPQAQHEQFKRVLGKKPAGILVSVGDPKLIQADIDAAIAQGIPVVTIDSDAPGSKRLTFIGTDNYRAGVNGGKVVAQKLQGKGTVVVFTIPEQGNLAERLRGYKDAFDSHPGIKIVDVIDMKGDPRIVFDKTKELLEKKAKIDAFVCLEAIACPEVADVIEREKAAGVVVLAMDTDQRTLDAIQKGLITATIAQKPFSMAYVGLKMLDEWRHHPLPSLTANFQQDSNSPVPAFVDTGATLIDKLNVAAFVQERNAATAK